MGCATDLVWAAQPTQYGLRNRDPSDYLYDKVIDIYLSNNQFYGHPGLKLLEADQTFT